MNITRITSAMRVEKGHRAAKAVFVLGLATLLLGACANGTSYGGYSGYGHRYGGGYYSGRAPTHRSGYGHGYLGRYGYRYGYGYGHRYGYRH